MENTPVDKEIRLKFLIAFPQILGWHKAEVTI